MNSATDNISSSQRIMLAGIRQALMAPAQAILGYSELINQAVVTDDLKTFKSDADEILSAARQLSDMINHLLAAGSSDVLFEGKDVVDVEKELRHDLRTPINAIKGYGEMLLEDLEELNEIGVCADLGKLLEESNQLLAKLGHIVNFTQGDMGAAAAELGAETLAADLVEFVDKPTPSSFKPLPEDTGYILVVDDIASNRDLLSRRLILDGHLVATASSGVEALEMLGGEDFDLVLLDVMMPGMSGLEVLARMKQHPVLKSTPVVMVSALDDTSSVIRCIEAGADDYLPKPINETLFRARIKSGLEKKHWLDEEKRQKKFIRDAFSRFVPEIVVDQLIKNPEQLSLGGRRQNLTVLFTDLEGFTRLVEGAEPAEVMPVLNRYLDGLCRIVLDHGGTIDKIIGDALLAFFGAPLEQPDHPERAMACVLELDAFCRAFQKEDEVNKLGFGKTRIGVHTGVAVVGNFGGESFFDYTVLGDVVNTAARMEAVNKQIGTRICISGDTASHCPDIEFRPIGTLLLAGKSTGVAAFEPVIEFGSKSLISDYRRAFSLLDLSEEEALEAFQSLANNYPDDTLIAFHARRLAVGESGSTIVFNTK
jgi:class 3 adenylate cyclase/ActR/RegA family two-component response regulator